MDKDKDKERLEEYSSKVTEQDIEKIDNKLFDMNKGPIKKIWGDVQALYRLIKDPNGAWSAKVVAIGALIYLISPIDAIPDITPIVGLLDDVGVLSAAVAMLMSELSKYRD